MSRPVNKYLSWAVILLFFLALGVVSWATPKAEQQTVIPRRWNPRRAPAGSEFVGDQGCRDCHKKQFSSHDQSGMAMAMEPVTDSKVLQGNPQLSMRVGPFTYEIKRSGRKSLYSVTDGKETITVPIVYAFGQGKAGQTYVLEREGKFYESLVSYYNEPDGLDFTIGAPRGVPPSLSDAVGRLLSEREVVDCFSCHSTGASSGGKLTLDKMMPGVRCEGCHGPGGEHIKAIKSGDLGSKLVFNPGRMGGDEMTQDFCATCHRGNEEFALLKSMGINNVRFQPYRIFHSKCYSDDRRISCTACHDPHEPVKVDAAYYDSKCLACHSLKDKPKAAGAGPSCPVASKDCTSCHMPKVELPAAHFKFTDHYIRTVKPDERFTN